MGAVGRLTNNGDLKITGELSNRIPSVKSGLKMCFPFDGTLEGEIWNDGWYGSCTANSHINDIQNSNMKFLDGTSIRFSGWFKMSGNLNGDVTLFYYRQINGAWNYQGASIKSQLINDEWVYISISLQVNGGTASDNITNNVQGISIRETCTTGSIQWKNCKCSIKANASNCTLTNHAIYIEEATTNLIPKEYAINNGQWGWGGKISTVNGLFNESAQRYTGQGFYISDPNINFNVGTTYTASCYIRLVEQGSSSHIVREGTGGGTSYADQSKIGKWQKVTLTWTENANRSGCLCFYGNGIRDICCLQVEAKSFSTSYTNGSRNDASLHLSSSILSSTEGSIVLDYYVNNTYPSTYSRIFEGGAWANPYTRDWISICRGTGWDNDRIDFYIEDISTSGCNRDNTSLSGINSLIGHWLKLIISYSKNNQKSRFYCYDMTSKKILLNAESTFTFDGFSNLFDTDLGIMCGSGSQNSCIKNLSFYHKYLSDTEIDKLSKGKLSITASGNIKSTDIIEMSTKIPSDAYYFPLDFDSKNRCKAFGAVNESDTIYNNGCVWIGQGTTNLCNNNIPQYNQWDGTGISTSINGNIMKAWSPTGIGFGILWGNVFTSATYNKTYTYSVKVKGVGSSSIVAHQAYDGSGNDAAVFSKTIKLNPDSWSTLSITYSLNSPHTNGNVLVYLSAGTGNYVEIKDVCITDLPYITEYIPSNTYRSTSKLEFDLNGTIGMDWSKDWSIVYWKKPVATHEGNLIGYNIESIGCNSNSVGGGYIWWGKQNHSNFLSLGNGDNLGNVDPNNYFNTWQMVSLQKSGTTITYKNWSDNGIITGTTTTTNSVSNYYKTQYGYDFKLGGWDSNAICNTYFKDLIIVKNRRMSDDELTSLFKTRMSQKNDLYIQGELLENINL